MKSWALVLAFGMVSAPLQAGSLNDEARAGYLLEWELFGTVTTTGVAGVEEFTRWVTWKHVGLCSVSGPQEKSGDLQLRIQGSGSMAQLHGTLWFDGARYVFGRPLSGTSNGYMECPHAQSVPISISTK
jgi:hypothetical protein